MTTDTTKQRLILYVDDEEQALKYFDKVFSRHFAILTASSTDQALRLLEERAADVGVIMSDQRMPKRLGIDLLADVRKLYPHIVRILTTAYAELDNAIDAVNQGEIYRYITKPWNIQELKATLHQALIHSQATPTGVSPYAILAAGLSGRFRGSKLAVTKMVEHWPQNSASLLICDTRQLISMADTLHHASSAMDDDLTLVHLEERIKAAPGFAGTIISEDRTGAMRFQANARLVEATVQALARISSGNGLKELHVVTLKSEIRNKVPGIHITWPVLGEIEQTINWSPDLLLTYLFVIHHGGQITVNKPVIELWLPQSPRDVNVPRDIDQWLNGLL